MIMKNIALIVSVVVFSFLLTGLIRRYAKSRNIVDVPNERSSHAIPTPRGGGLSIAATFLVGIWFVEPVSRSILWSLVSSGIVVAGIGLWDDHSSIRARWRLLVHFLAALLAVFFLGGFVGSSLNSDSLNNALVVTGLVILSLVWLLNLFNFMDGIDGIAASEAIFISSSGALFCWLNGLEGLAIVSLIMAASTGVFLLLNYNVSFQSSTVIFFCKVFKTSLTFFLSILPFHQLFIFIPSFHSSIQSFTHSFIHSSIHPTIQSSSLLLRPTGLIGSNSDHIHNVVHRAAP